MDLLYRCIPLGLVMVGCGWLWLVMVGSSLLAMFGDNWIV